MDNLLEITDDELASVLANRAGPTPPVKQPPAKWLPSLTKAQMEVFFDQTKFLLVPGNRYTGKGMSSGYACVKHAYDYHNALVLAVVKTKRQALTGGWMSKVSAEILPEFEKHLQGFKWRGPRVTAEKDLVIEIQNRHGTWSVIQLMSIQHDQEVEKKTKGIEASLVYIDEVTLFLDEIVFTQLANTLGRRNHIPAKAQRMIATCNPDSPDHWVAKRWDVLAALAGKQGNPKYRVIPVMREDNPDPKVAEYYELLFETLKNDKTKLDRDYYGKWVHAPDGEAIFGMSFQPDYHVKGDISRGELLHPKPGVKCYIGADVGDVNHGLEFFQERITDKGPTIVVFDEIVHVGKMVSIPELAVQLMGAMQSWCEEEDFDFQWGIISDKSAFDRFRAINGSFDHLELLKQMRKVAHRFPRVKIPRDIEECPKAQGSVSTRLRQLRDLMMEDRFFVSAKCEELINSLKNITSKKGEMFSPSTTSPYKHAIDSLTYGLLYLNVGTVTTSAPTHQESTRLIATGG